MDEVELHSTLCPHSNNTHLIIYFHINGWDNLERILTFHVENNNNNKTYKNHSQMTKFLCLPIKLFEIARSNSFSLYIYIYIYTHNTHIFKYVGI